MTVWNKFVTIKKAAKPEKVLQPVKNRPQNLAKIRQNLRPNWRKQRSRLIPEPPPVII